MSRGVSRFSTVRVQPLGRGRDTLAPLSWQPLLRSAGRQRARGCCAAFGLWRRYFNPTFIRANAGQKVTLHLKNEGKATHNFSFAAASVDQDIPPEGNANITITMPANGVALIFCKIHKSQGMAGELLVGDASPAAP